MTDDRESLVRWVGGISIPRKENSKIKAKGGRRAWTIQAQQRHMCGSDDDQAQVEKEMGGGGSKIQKNLEC